ncbi:hypothetical protein ADL22_17015 [Streptomyces sp. NRRL F-4489]|nr:hypothetical protein ADL22_17015 [Streptomyces sp. NRRL F-4489]
MGLVVSTYDQLVLSPRVWASTLSKMWADRFQRETANLVTLFPLAPVSLPSHQRSAPYTSPSR